LYWYKVENPYQPVSKKEFERSETEQQSETYGSRKEEESNQKEESSEKIVRRM
jgi:hypothetical protein